MARTKNITLSVHRAIIDEHFPWTLADLLDQIKSKLNTGNHVVNRGFFDKTAVKFPSFPRTNQAVTAQFALYEEGAEKSTIQPLGVSESYSTTSLSPPNEVEFLDHEVAILVDGNFMIACGLGNRQVLLIDVISELAKRCDIEMHPTAMWFANTPNHLTVEKIHSIGVKSVLFDATNFLGSLNIPTNSLIGEIFGKMATDVDLEKQEMVAELSLRPKKLSRAKLETVATPKNKWLERTATKTLKDQEVSSYTIILNDGSEWKEGDLKLSRSVTLPKDGSSFNMPKALQAMLDYLEELRKGDYLH